MPDEPWPDDEDPPFQVGDFVWADHWNPLSDYLRVRRVFWRKGEWFVSIGNTGEMRIVHAFEVYRVDVIDALADLA